ncbi:MAG: histidine phosphatase family protein [Alcanivorax sp.]
MTILIIARHGNTFGPGDTPTRVGKNTDIPLVEKGQAQAKAIGTYLKNNDLIPDVAYSSTLMRTKQTAELAIKNAGISLPVYPLDIFDEVDYGPDENQTEDVVINRIGKDAIEKWDKDAIVPDGWNVNPDDIIHNWKQFGRQITKTHDSLTNDVLDIREKILVVTSNGIARFAPHLTESFTQFAKEHTIKLKTGALGILEHNQGEWRVTGWNIVPISD